MSAPQVASRDGRERVSHRCRERLPREKRGTASLLLGMGGRCHQFVRRRLASAATPSVSSNAVAGSGTTTVSSALNSESNAISSPNGADRITSFSASRLGARVDPTHRHEREYARAGDGARAEREECESDFGGRQREFGDVGGGREEGSDGRGERFEERVVVGEVEFECVEGFAGRHVGDREANVSDSPTWIVRVASIAAVAGSRSTARESACAGAAATSRSANAAAVAAVIRKLRLDMGMPPGRVAVSKREWSRVVVSGAGGGSRGVARIGDGGDWAEAEVRERPESAQRSPIHRSSVPGAPLPRSEAEPAARSIRDVVVRRRSDQRSSRVASQGERRDQ